MLTDERDNDDGLDDHDRARASEMDERPIYPALGEVEVIEDDPEIQEVAA